MDNFDELIKQYAVKIVDDENSTIVRYSLKRHPYTSTIKVVPKEQVDNPDYYVEPVSKKGRALSLKTFYHTPFGVFDDIQAAASACNCGVVTVYVRIRESVPGYSKEVKSKET